MVGIDVYPGPVYFVEELLRRAAGLNPYPPTVACICSRREFRQSGEYIDVVWPPVGLPLRDHHCNDW